MSFHSFAASTLFALFAASSFAQPAQQPPKPEFVIPKPDAASPRQEPAMGSYVIGAQDQLKIVFAASSFAQPAQQPPKPEFVIPKPDAASPRQEPAMGSYVIGAQDQLKIVVVDEPDLTGTFRVDSDGTITYPYLNQLRVAGLTIDEARNKITDGLKNGFLKNPQVRIEIEQFKARSVMVMGQVRTPGKVPLTGVTMSLLEALAVAGSPTAGAANEVRVQRQARPGERQPEPIVVNRRDLENGRTDFQVRLEE